MDVSKINPFLNDMGFSASNISSISDKNEIQKFANENGIDISEAEKILKQANTEATQKENLFKEYNEIQELLNSQDEEEIIVVDDMDFDSFLREDNPEQKIQELIAQQQFLKNNNNQENTQDKNNKNIFLKTNW